MAVKGLTVKQKSALAEIVSSETLNDIEEYIRPQFPPKLVSKDLLISENNLPKANISLNPYSRRRIVQDGHGRWREVKPQLYSSNVQSGLRNKLASTGKRQHSLGSKDGSITKCANNRSHEHENANYNNLSMALRSNVFPGLGNNQWHSTTAKVFIEQEIIPPHQRDSFFGMQTDAFGQWSAANVLHERMKKTWDTYIDTLPKQAGINLSLTFLSLMTGAKGNSEFCLFLIFNVCLGPTSENFEGLGETKPAVF